MYTKCPICDSIVEVDIAFAKQNGRIFCGTCCRAFDISIEEEKPEKVIEYDDLNYW